MRKESGITLSWFAVGRSSAHFAGSAFSGWPPVGCAAAPATTPATPAVVASASLGGSKLTIAAIIIEIPGVEASADSGPFEDLANQKAKVISPPHAGSVLPRHDPRSGRRLSHR